MFLKRLIINNLNLIDNLVIPICNYFCSPRNSADMKKFLKCAKIRTWTNLRQMFGNVFLVRVRLYCHKTLQTRTNFLSEENKKKLLMGPRLRALLCFFTLHKCVCWNIFNAPKLKFIWMWQRTSMMAIIGPKKWPRIAKLEPSVNGMIINFCPSRNSCKIIANCFCNAPV